MVSWKYKNNENSQRQDAFEALASQSKFAQRWVRWMQSVAAVALREYIPRNITTHVVPFLPRSVTPTTVTYSKVSSGIMKHARTRPTAQRAAVAGTKRFLSYPAC